MGLLNTSGNVLILYETMEEILKKEAGIIRASAFKSTSLLFGHFSFWKQIHSIFPECQHLEVISPKGK